MTTSPVLDALLGLGMLGLAAYQLYTGVGFGRIRKFGRQENPGYFWFLVVIETIVGLVWLSRALSH